MYNPPLRCCASSCLGWAGVCGGALEVLVGDPAHPDRLAAAIVLVGNSHVTLRQIFIASQVCRLSHTSLGTLHLHFLPLPNSDCCLRGRDGEISLLSPFRLPPSPPPSPSFFFLRAFGTAAQTKGKFPVR